MENINVWVGLFIAIIVLIIWGILFPKVSKKPGQVGEENTVKLIKQFIKWKGWKENDYLLVSNLILQKENYWSCEIDILLLTRKWIYVIEVKDWQVGMLRGNFNDEYLTRSWKIRRRRKHWQERVYSPFYQNETHIKRLKSYFNISEPNILSVVVFNGDMGYNLKRNKKLILENKFVVTNHDKGRGIAEILANYERESTQLISFEQLREKISKELLIIDPKKARKHYSYIKSAKEREKGTRKF